MAGLSSSEVAILLKAQDQASPVIKQVSGELHALGESGSGLGSKLSGVGSALAGIATTAAVGGIAAVAAGFGAAVKSGADFEKQMSAIAAVSGASASELASLQQAALDLGAKTSFSAKEAAEGIEELVKAGVSIKDILGGGAAAALDLAAAGGVKVSEAAELASNAMNVFNLKGEDMGHVADVIAGAANASAISVSEYRMSLAAAGAVAATVGVGFDDLSTAIALMGNAGIKGSDAGTSLKTMLINLSPSSKAATTAMRELGIITASGANQFFTAEGKAKSLAEIAGVLQEATKNLTSEQKLNYLQTIFGTDAIRAAAVMAEAGADGFRELAGEIGKVTAQEVAAKRLDNLWGAIEQLKGSAETAAIAVGLKLLPGLTKLTQWATDQVNAAIPSLEAFAAQVAITIETVSKIVTDLFDVFNGGDSGDAAFDLLSRLMPPDAAMAIVEAIGKIGDAWRTLIEVFTSGWEPSDTIDPFVNAVGELALVFRDQIIPAVQDVTQFIMEQFGTVISWFRENWPLIAETNTSVIALLTKEWGDTGASLPNIVRVAWAAVKTVISTELQAALGIVKAQLQILNGDWSGAWQTIQEVVAVTTRATEDLLYLFFGGTIEAMRSWVENSEAATQTWGERVLTSITGTLDAVSRALTDAWNAATSATSDAMSGIQEAVQAVWDQIPEDIRADLEKIATHLATQGTAWVASLRDTGQNMLTALVTALASMVDAVTTWASSTFLTPIQGLTASSSEAMTSAGTGMLAAISAGLADIVGRVTGWVGEFLAPIRGLAGQAQAEAAGIGSAIVNGITGAIAAGIGSIRSMAYQAARAALDAAKSALGIESPSKAFAQEVGLPIVQGMAMGILNNRDLALQAAGAMAEAARQQAIAALRPNNGASWNAALSQLAASIGQGVSPAIRQFGQLASGSIVPGQIGGQGGGLIPIGLGTMQAAPAPIAPSRAGAAYQQHDVVVRVGDLEAARIYAVGRDLSVRIRGEN